jgi:succinate dehydrogenase flavin-adding protein (antitoxin of CptAB toxin-antitoxin module)
MAAVLSVPLAFLNCDDDQLAEIILAASRLPSNDQEQLLKSLRIRLDELRSGNSSTG